MKEKNIVGVRVERRAQGVGGHEGSLGSSLKSGVCRDRNRSYNLCPTVF